MDLIPIVVYCAISLGNPTNICTTLEDISIQYNTKEECLDKANDLLNNMVFRQESIDTFYNLGVPYFDNKIEYRLYCIERKDLDDFLYNFIGVERSDQDV